MSYFEEYKANRSVLMECHNRASGADNRKALLTAIDILDLYARRLGIIDQCERCRRILPADQMERDVEGVPLCLACLEEMDTDTKRGG